MRRLHTLISIVVAALVLSGCLPSKLNVLRDPARLEQLPANHGIVMARIVDASGDRLPINFLTFAPQDVFEDKENKFSRTEALEEPGLPNTQRWSSHYLGTLEPGVYSVAQLDSIYIIGEYRYQNTAALTPTFGTFEIKPGQITNLGTLVYYRKAVGDRFQEIVVKNDSFPNAPELLASRYAHLAPSASPDLPTLGWIADDFDTERRSEYLSVVQNPTAFGPSYSFEDEILVLSKAGALLRGSTDNGWQLDFVESDSNLLAYDRNDQGLEIVSGEFGALFVRPKGQAEWTEVPPPVPLRWIPGVAVTNDNSIYAYVEREKDVILYRGDASENPGWQHVMQFARNGGWRSIEQLPGVPPTPSSGGLGLVNNTFYSKRDGKHLFLAHGAVFEMDFDSRAGKRLDVDFNLASIAPLRNILVGESTVSFWTSERSYGVANGFDGEWTKIKSRIDRCPNQYSSTKSSRCADQRLRYGTHNILGNPYFFSLDRGYAMLRTRSIARGLSDEERAPFLGITDNGGDSWTRFLSSPELPEFCNRLLPPLRPNTLLLACSGTNGRIYEASLDDFSFELLWEPSAF